MVTTKSQNSNMLLAFLTLLGVIAIVAVVGFFMLRKGPEIILHGHQPFRLQQF